MPATFTAAFELAISRSTPKEWDAMSQKARTMAIYAALRELDLAETGHPPDSMNNTVTARSAAANAPQRSGWRQMAASAR